MATLWPFEIREESTKIPRLKLSGVNEEPSRIDNKFSLRSSSFDRDARFSILVEIEKAVDHYFQELGLTAVIEFCAIISSPENRIRRSIKIKTENAMGHSEEEFFLRDLAGSISVEIFCVLAEDLNLGEEKANKIPSKRGTILRTFPKIEIRIDEPDKKNGNEFPTQWVSFRDRSDLSAFQDSVHFVDLENDIVLVNDDLPFELKSILQSEAPGNIGAMRQAMLAPVAIDICEQLARAALLKAQNEDGVEFLEGHYKNLVEDLCFLISGYDNREDAFDYLNEVTRNEKRLFEEVLATKLPLVCQQYLQVGKTLRKHAKTVSEA